MKFSELPASKQIQIRQFDERLRAWEKHILQEAQLAHEMLVRSKQNPEDQLTYVLVFATMTYWSIEPDPLWVSRINPPVAQRRYNCGIILDSNAFLEKCTDVVSQEGKNSDHPMSDEPHCFLLHDLCEAIRGEQPFDFDDLFKIEEISCDIEITLPFTESIDWACDA